MLVEICQDKASGRSWTFAELLKEAGRLALILSTRFNPGERVVVFSPNNPEWVFMEYACTLAGPVLVTVNPAFQARELDYALKQSEAVAVFLVKEFHGNPMGLTGSEVAKDILASQEVIFLDSDALYAVGPLQPAIQDVAPGEVAMVQYVSDTTGFSKEAALCRYGLVNKVRFYAT